IVNGQRASQCHQMVILYTSVFGLTEARVQVAVAGVHDTLLRPQLLDPAEERLEVVYQRGDFGLGPQGRRLPLGTRWVFAGSEVAGERRRYRTARMGVD